MDLTTIRLQRIFRSFRTQMNKIVGFIFLFCALVSLLPLNLSYHNSKLSHTTQKIGQKQVQKKQQIYQDKQEHQDQQKENHPNESAKIGKRHEKYLIPWDGVLLKEDLLGMECNYSLNMSLWNKQGMTLYSFPYQG